MAVTYATPEDLTKYPFLIPQAGATDLTQYPFMLKALTNKANTNPFSGMDLNAVQNMSKEDLWNLTAKPVDNGMISWADSATGKTTLVPKSLWDQNTGKFLDISTGAWGDAPGKINSFNDFLMNLLANPTASSSSNLAGSSVGDLSKEAKLFKDVYDPAMQEGYFQDYLGKIGAPSSVEESQRGIESDILNQTLAEIERGTRGDIATTKLDMGERGLLGPGRTSDIAENALAQRQAMGERTAAGARSQIALAEIARQRAKEEAVRGAYGKRYEFGAQAGLQGALSDQQIMNELLSTEYKGKITMGEGALDRQSKEKLNTINQLVDYIKSSAELSQQDRQFYDNLQAQMEQAALGRTANWDIENLKTGGKEPSAFEKLLMDTVTTIVGGGTGKLNKTLWG